MERGTVAEDEAEVPADHRGLGEGVGLTWCVSAGEPRPRLDP